MVATKTNERPGTRAVVRYVRVSASKARELLNLVRGESYGRAAEILAFSERSVSDVVGKLLESAVANAENNDGIPAEELFISTCYADEGPTLKRWRPRARGRATRINKRTCHITIIVTRYDEATLETMRERDAAKGRVGSSAHAAEARRQRVERSRAAAAEEAAAEEAAHDHDHDEVAADAVSSEDSETAAEPDTAEASDGVDGSVAEDATDMDEADESADDAEKEAN
jgi:large subunit ribosomal protein L22